LFHPSPFSPGYSGTPFWIPVTPPATAWTVRGFRTKYGQENFHAGTVEHETKKVIRFPQDALLQTRWIGVDLNTTGHAVVAADPVSGKILKLGKKLHYAQTASTQNCTKLYREGKLWKLKKNKSREKKEFKSALHKIARQIVGFAESFCAGVKFEKLFSYRYVNHRTVEDSYEFSFENSSFVTLLNLIEKRALSRGIPVEYVNPMNTSKRCSRCGAFGRRVRKRFECPQCGRVIHADVNAALNIAATPCTSGKIELFQVRASRKMMRKLARAGQFDPAGTIPRIPDYSGTRELLSPWSEIPAIPEKAG
jgi:putative transposase